MVMCVCVCVCIVLKFLVSTLVIIESLYVLLEIMHSDTSKPKLSSRYITFDNPMDHNERIPFVKCM
mgnify:CR=1 FL=1